MAFISTTPLSRLSLASSSRTSSVVQQVRRGSWNRFSGMSVRAKTATGNVCMTLEPFHATTQLLTENPLWLEKVAESFRGMPEPLIQYGHPAMMAILVFAMGFPGAYIGWQGRLNENKREGVNQKKLHENVMLGFFLFAFLGSTGGTLSVAVQGFDIWESPHAISALVVLLLLAANSLIAYTGFTIGTDGTPKGRLQGRKLHSYFGIAVMGAFLVHAGLGVKLLLG